MIKKFFIGIFVGFFVIFIAILAIILLLILLDYFKLSIGIIIWLVIICLWSGVLGMLILDKFDN